MSSSDDTARTITSIIAGCVVVAGAIVVLVIAGMAVIRSLRKDLETAQLQIEAIRKDMEVKKAGGGQIVTLDDLMKPYKKHLLQSAFDLQSRLGVQLGTLGSGKFLNTFSKRGQEDRAYAINSTIYFFAEFLGWLEVIRSKVVFVTGSEYAESLNSLLDSIRYQLTGETPVQGCPKDKKDTPKTNDETYDVNHKILQLYIVDLRSIGNAMLVGHEDFVRPMTVDLFLQKFDPIEPLPLLPNPSGMMPAYDSLEQDLGQALSGPISTPTFNPAFTSFSDRPMTATTRARVEAQREAITKEALALEQEKRSFNKIMEPLRKHIIALTDMDPNHVPVRRLAIFQVLLCKLIAILDDANPWDTGPKFDQNEEPRYIQRDIRLTPAVKMLSNAQREFLRTQVFFQDDSSFSFPGFREDLKGKSQSERDDILWPGACPPLEPKKRPSYFKKDKAVMHTQGMALTSAIRRKLTQPVISSSAPKVSQGGSAEGGEGGQQHSPSRVGGMSMFAGIFSARGNVHNRLAGNKVHASPGGPAPKSALVTTHERPSKGKESHARFQSDVSGSQSMSKEGEEVPSVPPMMAQKRPLSTIQSEFEYDVEGGRDPVDIPGHVRGSAALLNTASDPELKDE